MKRDDLLQPDRTPCHAADVAGHTWLVEPGIHYAHARRADAGTSHAPIADGPGLVEAWIAGAGTGRPYAAVARRTRLVEAGVPRFNDEGKVRQHRTD
jgi:hypothetical protein